MANVTTFTGKVTPPFTGGVQRTLGGKIFEAVSVKDFGARFDGETDDTDAIIAAFASGEPLSMNFDGTAIISAPIVIPDGLILQGSGKDRVGFQWADVNDSGAIFSTRESGVINAKKTGIVMQDFFIDGGWELDETRSRTGSGISLTNTDDAHIERLLVYGTNDACIRADGYGDLFESAAWLRPETLPASPFTTADASTTVTVNHPRHRLATGGLVTFSGAAAVNGLTISGEYSITVTGDDSYTIVASGAASGTGAGGGSSVVAQNPRYTTRWYQSKNIFVRDCVMRNSYLGVEFEGGASGEICTNDISQIQVRPIRLTSARSTVVYKNTVDAAGLTGVYVDRSQQINILENDVIACETGVSLGRLDGGTIGNNYIAASSEMVYDGLLGGFSSDVTVYGTRQGNAGTIRTDDQSLRWSITGKQPTTHRGQNGSGVLDFWLQAPAAWAQVSSAAEINAFRALNLKTSDVSKTVTGQYNFTLPFTLNASTSNYVVLVTPEGGDFRASVTNKSNTAFRVEIRDAAGTLADAAFGVLVFAVATA